MILPFTAICLLIDSHEEFFPLGTHSTESKRAFLSEKVSLFMEKNTFIRRLLRLLIWGHRCWWDLGLFRHSAALTLRGVPEIAQITVSGGIAAVEDEASRG